MGTTRLFLRTLEHRGTKWNAYLSTTSKAAPSARMLLEFEPSEEGAGSERYTRPIVGELWRALQEGESLQTSQLEVELEKAIRPQPEVETVP